MFTLKMVERNNKKKKVSALVTIITILWLTVAQGAPTPKYDPFLQMEDRRLIRLDEELAIH